VNHGYYVIGDEDTVLGFRCAGVPGRVVGATDDVLAGVREARERATGIILITEGAADLAREQIEAIRFDGELPMVVEIPGPQGPIAGRRDLAAIIREAVGIKV